MVTKMKKTKMANRNNPTHIDGYDPIALTRAAERVVVRGNKRKYARLARPLRFVHFTKFGLGEHQRQQLAIVAAA